MVLFLVFSSLGVNAQCTITATTNASTLTCGTSPISSCGGIVYIGNGSTAMSLKMNANLDLTCLGAIQFIVRNNATLDYSGSNKDLKLAAGSSIVFETGSAIYSGDSSDCSASDRIYIGGETVGSCNGGAGGASFEAIVANGGINSAGVLSGNQYVCTYGTTTRTFTSTESGGTWSSSNTSIATVNSSGLVTAVAAGTATITYTRSGTTATRAIYVASGGPSNAVITGSNSQCQSTTANYSAAPVSGVSAYNWSYSGTGATITPASNGLSASISFSSTATSGNLKVTTTNGCATSSGGNELWITINPAISAVPAATSATSIDCYYAVLNWNTVTNASGYYLDIATNSGFTTFVTGYNNFYVPGNNSSYGAANLPSGTLYYRVRGYNSCTTTANSNTVSFQTTAPLGGTVSSAQSICSGTSPANLTLSGYTSTSTGIKWQKSSDAAFTSPTDISVNSATLSSAAIGNLTASTYFRAVVQNQFGSWCSSNSTSVLITVNNTVSTASSTPTVCYNTAITPITHTVIGFSGIGTVTGLPTGVTPSLSGSTLTISGTPTASGTFNYIIQLTGGSCGAGTANATGTITVNQSPAGLSYTAASPSYCVGIAITANNASLTTTGSPAAAYSVSPALPAGLSLNASTGAITGTPTAAVAATAYTVTAANSCGNVTSIVNITVNARPVPTYTVQPGAASCIGTDVTYTTQSGMSNYIWTVPGTLNTDYSITSGGIGTGSNTVTLKWLTTGSKTITVNYTSVCTGISAASNTTTVGDLPNNVSNGFSASTICAGGSPQLTFDAVDASFSSPYSITYRNDATLAQYTIAIPSASAYSFTPGDNPTSNANYSLISISNANCTRTSSFGNSGANLIVRPTPTASISGTTAVCTGASSPNITFTNPQTVAVTVTYKINGGADQTVNIAASSSANVAVSTAASGSFVYSLVSVIYQSTPACSNALSGSATVTVNSLSIAPASITGTTAICSGNSTTLTVSGGTAGTGAVAEWFTGSCNGTAAGTGNSITVSPTSNTTYYVRYSGTCNITACASQLVTVNPLPDAAGTITGTVTVCQGQTNVGYSVPSIANAASYSWSYSGTGATITNGTTNTPTITFASNATSGDLTVYGIDSCGNGIVSANFAVTVNPLSSAPTIGTITHVTCVAAGSAVLSGLPASGTVFQTGTTAASYAITGASMTISGLAAGTYQFYISNGTCPSASTGNVVINASGTKTWNGTAWSPSAPASSDIAVINADYSTSSNGNLNACSVILNSGFTLTIEADQFVTIQNNLTVNGTLSILDKGSLVMVNDAGTVDGSGSSIVRRMTTPYKKNDYVYWSTPVSTSAISSAATGTFPGWRTGYAYEYNNAWVGASTMTPAKGYIVMVPDPTSAPGGNISEAVFKGKVNNGIYKIGGVAASKSYLLGNPYPSAIDADQFILQNSGVIGGTLYFWTHNTAIQLASNITNGTAGSGTYAYTSDDYASYNITGGTATAKAAKSGSDAPLGKIASGQGFFTTSKASISSTEFVFNNSMRVSSGSGSNSQFYKTKASQNTNKTAAIEKHRVWLNLSNDQGAFKQTLLGYIGGATNGNDEFFDGKTLDGNKFIDFYSVNQNANLVIQGRALPFDDKDEVPLGYKTAVDGSFTINIEKTDGLLVNQAVYLQDKLTNTEIDLKGGSYTFTTVKGTFNNRFVLKYKSAKTLGTETFDAQADQVVVSVKNKQIKITSSVETIAKVLVYDISGKQIYKNDSVNSNEFTAADFSAADQVLIVKTTLENGAVTTDKIVF